MDYSVAAAQLLQSTQRMRVAWTAFIGSLLGYASALYIGIWSFFLKAYIDATDKSTDRLNYILIASASSAVILGLWRFYTRHLDNAIACLYPTLVHCEQTMGVPPEYGTAVKGGVKLDHWGGEKVDHFAGGRGRGLKDLRGRLERRPATRLAGRV